MGTQQPPRVVPALLGGIVLVGGLGALYCTVPPLRKSGSTIYPWSTYVFALALVVAGVVLLVCVFTAHKRWLGPVAVVALVTAMQLGGIGSVAVKHWGPSFGMGGGYGDPHQLERQAWLLAFLGTISGLAALGMLAIDRQYVLRSRVWTQVLCVGTGVLFVVLVPFAVGAGSAENRDATSLGAYALMYGLPWGITLVLAGFLKRPTDLWAIGAVIVSATFCVFRARMVDLIFWDATPAFAVAALVGVIVFAARASVGSDDPRTV
jgi:hypothetical protein